MIELKRGTDQTVQLRGLRTNDTPPVYLNTAAMTGTLIDPDGVAVEGFTGFVMQYVPDTDGIYEWALDGARFMPPTSTLYTLEIVAVQGAYNFRSVYGVAVID